MKRIYIVGLLLTAICFLGSCTRQSTDDRYHVPFLNSNQYELDFQPSDGVLYGSSFWYIQEESGAVHRLDLNDSHEDIFDTELASPALICVSDSGITVYDSSEKAVYRFQGDTMELLLRVEVPAECREVVRLDSKDGFTTVSDGLTLYLLPDEGEDWSSFSFETPIRDYRMTDRNTVVALESGANHVRIVRKDLKRNRINVLSEQNAVSLESNCGAVWMWDEGDNRIFTIRDGGAKVWYTFREGSHSLKKVMITEHNIAVLPEGEAVLYLLARVDTGEAVTILTNSYGREKVTGWNEISDLPVRIVSYEDEQFFDKLNTRLLAGDDDFDLVYVSGSVMDTPVFANSFLKYGIFSDLSENERLDKNLRETTPGLMNLISYDGQYAAIPTDVFFRLFSIDRSMVSASEPEDDVVRMTMDDLWKIGDQLLASREERGLFDQYKWIFLSNLLISELQDQGKFTEDKPPENAREIIDDFFARLERYRDAGLLEGSNPVIKMTDSMMFQDYRKSKDDTERVYVLPVGRVRRKTAVNMIGFVFVNPNSKHKQLALDLLADLTDEENRYNTKGFGELPLYPGLDSYYFNDPSRKAFSQAYAANRAVPEDISLLDQNLETIWTCSEPYTVCFSEAAHETMNAFFEARITGAEAADRLYRELIYSIKG